MKTHDTTCKGKSIPGFPDCWHCDTCLYTECEAQYDQFVRGKGTDYTVGRDPGTVTEFVDDRGTDYTGPMPEGVKLVCACGKDPREAHPTFNERNFRRGYLNGYEQGLKDALGAGPKDRTKLEGHDVEWKDTVSRTMNEINRKWRTAINSLLSKKPEK